MSAVRDRALTPGVLAPGHKLGRYEILAKLASGGMAVVYVASAQGAAGFERLVALKVLHANLAHEEEFIGMFLDEARLAARIRHPNVVATIDISDTEQTGYYLVMEYVEGDHLGALLSAAHKLGERIAVPIVLRVVVDALAGLGAAHHLRDDRGDALNIVHRDVSPHNILVGRDGITRLTDFGVAKAEGRLTHTRDGQVKGKLAYMAPEQASSGSTDSRSDLFSAGIILWECVTGRRLFRADNTAATLVKLLSEPIAPPSAIDPALAPLDPVLKKALDRDPVARFQTADEFIEAIEWVAPRMGGVASPRAVSKAVMQYAADKLARDRKLIEIAQRSIRGGDLFPDGAEPSSPSLPSDVSLASMSRSRPSGVLAGATAPRLFTRGRAQKPTPTAGSIPRAVLEPPPPLGEIPPSLVVPAGGPESELGTGRRRFAAVVLALLALLGLGTWLALSRPNAEEPRVRPLPLDPPVSSPSPPPQAPQLPLDAVAPVSPANANGAAARAGERKEAPRAAPSGATASELAGAKSARPAVPPRTHRPRRTGSDRTRERPASSTYEQGATTPLPNPYMR